MTLISGLSLSAKTDFSLALTHSHSPSHTPHGHYSTVITTVAPFHMGGGCCIDTASNDFMIELSILSLYFLSLSLCSLSLCRRLNLSSHEVNDFLIVELPQTLYSVSVIVLSSHLWYIAEILAYTRHFNWNKHDMFKSLHVCKMDIQIHTPTPTPTQTHTKATGIPVSRQPVVCQMFNEHRLADYHKQTLANTTVWWLATTHRDIQTYTHTQKHTWLYQWLYRNKTMQSLWAELIRDTSPKHSGE